jgi:hypothetical protein
MVLATIIRLEMAYPGVGILAGDSLQYLSVVTAHAVIMVFFMITPVIFGAFGNFLLPTQLGVHDVAFPRLNSAAFWFLPASLIMLGQLVCVDRRYQRMNCFNIREVEALLKGRFFPDLINTHDHRILLNNSIIGLRFKTNNLDTINHSLLLFTQYGTSLTNNKRTNLFELKSNVFINNYEFFNSNSISNLIFKKINFLFYKSYNFLNPVLMDTYLLIIELFSPNSHNSAVFLRGYMSLCDLAVFSVNFLKSEIERQLLNISFIFDINKPIYFIFL